MTTRKRPYTNLQMAKYNSRFVWIRLGKYLHAVSHLKIMTRGYFCTTKVDTVCERPLSYAPDELKIGTLEEVRGLQPCPHCRRQIEVWIRTAAHYQPPGPRAAY